MIGKRLCDMFVLWFMGRELIKAAAVHINDSKQWRSQIVETGFVIVGHRHCSVLYALDAARKLIQSGRWNTINSVTGYLNIKCNHFESKVKSLDSQDFVEAVWIRNNMQVVCQPPNIKQGFVLGSTNNTALKHIILHILLSMFGQVKSQHIFFCETQGFITSAGKFVNRTEAAKIAFKAGQIGKLVDELYSEMIY